jgi:hypothetical protein
MNISNRMRWVGWRMGWRDLIGKTQGEKKTHLEDDRRTSEHNIRIDLDQWDSM